MKRTVINVLWNKGIVRHVGHLPELTNVCRNILPYNKFLMTLIALAVFSPLYSDLKALDV